MSDITLRLETNDGLFLTIGRREDNEYYLSSGCGEGENYNKILYKIESFDLIQTARMLKMMAKFLELESEDSQP